MVSFNVRELNPHDVSMILDETSKIHRKVNNMRYASIIIYIDVQDTVRASFGPYNTIEEVDVYVGSVNLLVTSFF